PDTIRAKSRWQRRKDENFPPDSLRAVPPVLGGLADLFSALAVRRGEFNPARAIRGPRSSFSGRGKGNKSAQYPSDPHSWAPGQFAVTPEHVRLDTPIKRSRLRVHLFFQLIRGD